MASASTFRLEELDGKVALVTFDLPDKKVNTLGHPVLAELDELVGQLEKRTDLRGLLFRSGKPGGLGVGLALSHATVERLGGDMTMTAAEGGGVRIQFQLPAETTVTS